jgi:hypothetical protein
MTQSDKILEHLRSGQTLTPLEALRKYGCLRLGARVYDLKQKGVTIDMRLIETETGAHVAEYSIPIQGSN